MAAKKKAGGRNRPQKVKKDEAELIDQDLIYGLGHPLRVRCLALLCDEPSSPRRLSDALDENLSSVAYHMGILRDTGLIELVETRPVRGAVEHIYRPVYPLILPEGLWSALPKPARQKIYADVLVDIDNDVTSSVKAETFDARDDFHVSWTPLRLDELGCQKLAEKADRWLEEMVEVQSESAQRLGEDEDAECIPISAALLIFESAREKGKQASERKRG
jgi:DNA-binding transcriptional ArsR family regulator